METHSPIKPEKIAQLGAVFLEQSLTLPKLFVRKSFDEFVGAEDDKVGIVVEGVLPYRLYGWRSDRSVPIVFDDYREKKVQVGFNADVPYSGVRLTDEQSKMDLNGWTKLTQKQTEAIGRGLNHEAARFIEKLPSVPGATPFDYEVQLGVPEYALRWGLVNVRALLNRLMVPGARSLIVGTNWEAALLQDDKLNLAQNVGDGEAVSSLREATIGRRYQFDIVVDTTIDPDSAYAVVDSAFAWLNAAPAVPNSVPAGGLGSHEDVALRWIQDYDTEYFRDRSVFNTWNGFQVVPDRLAGWDPDTKQGVVGEYEHFIRAIKLTLTRDQATAQAATVIPTKTSGTGDAAKKATELATLTGIKPITVPTFEQANAAQVIVKVEQPAQ